MSRVPNKKAETLSSLGLGEKSLLPDIFTLMKLCLTLPASTATAERSFSTLRRVKTYLRSTMNQERLNHVMILNTYKERVDDLDVNRLLRTFIASNDIRRRTFAMPDWNCAQTFYNILVSWSIIMWPTLTVTVYSSLTSELRCCHYMYIITLV